MDWLYYLLEANLYLLLFYGFYRLFLQNETFYNSNRYFLLLATITAFALPILQLGFLNPNPIIDNTLFPPPILYTEEQLAKMTFAPVQETFIITDWLYRLYLLIVLGFAIKLSISLFKIIRLWLSANKAKTGNVTLIELNEQITAFSFFNLLFIHPHLAEKQTILDHEMVHIKQKHSLDILFFELLQIVCWFNPFIYFIKKDIKLLHEYIADDLSTNGGIQKHEYAMFLIENSFGVVPKPLTNQIFNQSILKRRINMLNKKRTRGWARLRLLLALPLVGAMLCASTMAFTKDYGYIDLLPEKSKTVMTVQQDVPQEKEAQVKFPPPIIRQDKNSFYPMRSVDRKGNVNSQDIRLIVINGKKIETIETFYGVTNITKFNELDATSAKKKYGNIAKYGAVEITGKNLKYVKSLADGPPPPIRETVKFPPPVVKSDKVSSIKKEIDSALKRTYITGFTPNGKNGASATKSVYGYTTNKQGVPLAYTIGKEASRNNVSGAQSVYANDSNAQNITYTIGTQATKNNVDGSQVTGKSVQRVIGKYTSGKSVYAESNDANNLTGTAFNTNIKVPNVLKRGKDKKLIIPSAPTETKSLTIYNRWGNVIYSNDSYNNDWDGLKDNEDQSIAAGTYYYFISIKDSNKKATVAKGYISIM
jgi:hypothetical protein